MSFGVITPLELVVRAACIPKSHAYTKMNINYLTRKREQKVVLQHPTQSKFKQSQCSVKSMTPGKEPLMVASSACFVNSTWTLES